MSTFTPAVPLILRRLVECGLTIRELEVIDATADGMSYAEVGAHLTMAHGTVHKHLERISRKAGVGTRSGVVGYAYRKGLLVRVPDLPVPITARQKELLPYVAEGLENREIGVKLGIATDTVRSHLLHMAKPLGSRTRAHMVRRAIDTGALPLVTRLAEGVAG